MQIPQWRKIVGQRRPAASALSDADNVPPSGLGPFQRRSRAAQPPPMATDACVRLGRPIVRPIDHLFAAKRWASAACVACDKSGTVRLLRDLDG